MAMPQTQGAGMVNQVQVICILMIVHGTLASLMSLLYLVMAFFFPLMMASAPPQNAPNGPDPEMMGWIMFGVYMAMGLATLIGGVLQIYAGIRNMSFRGHLLGMIALVAGLAAMASCYCAPTAIALLVYGLIVYLNAEVKLAFQMGERGMDKQQIIASFYQQPQAPGMRTPYNPPMG